MATEKALRAAAKEMQDVMGLEPPLNVKAPLATLTEQFTEAIAQIQKGDEFSEATQAVIDEFNTPEEEEEEVVVPKRKAAAAPAPAKKKAKTSEPEEEEDEPEEDAEEDEDVVPKKGAKPAAKGKATPFKGTKETLGTSRMIECAKAMQNIKGSQTVDAIAAVADAKFIKAGGTANLKQDKNIIKVLLPAAETWGVVTVKGDKLSN
jgi:hypothetical protein